MNKYATLNILRGTVVVKYASNSYRMPDKLREAEIEGPIFDPSRDQQTNPLIRAMEPGIVPPKARTASHRPALTIRQLEVFHLIVQGRSNREIAHALNLAQGTVKVHVAALFGKLGVHRRAAVAIAGARFLGQRLSPHTLDCFGQGSVHAAAFGVAFGTQSPRLRAAGRIASCTIGRRLRLLTLLPQSLVGGPISGTILGFGFIEKKLTCSLAQMALRVLMQASTLDRELSSHSGGC